MCDAHCNCEDCWWARGQKEVCSFCGVETSQCKKIEAAAQEAEASYSSFVERGIRVRQEDARFWESQGDFSQSREAQDTVEALQRWPW